jgi:hypothetical protein
MSLRSLAAWLLLATAAAAPWMAGANTTLAMPGWWLALPLATAFGCLAGDRLKTKTLPALSWPVTLATLFLLGCLARWLTNPPPGFSTAFSEEHWRFLETQYPFVMLHWPHTGRVSFLIAALLGFLAAIDLGAEKKFRDRLLGVLATSGLLLACYALGIRWLGWTSPPWIQLPLHPEKFNVWFFHHNAPGAAFNLAWPLLLFRDSVTGKGRFVLVACVLAMISAAVFPPWHSISAPAIAAGLFALGTTLRWLHSRKPVASQHLFRGLIAVLFAGIFSWQAWSVVALEREHPDGWESAAKTRAEAAVRDAALKSAASRRGDRLVVSDAPARPAAWLTAWRMAKDYPLVGLGPGSWVTQAVLYSNDSLVNTFYQHRQFAHHDLLQVAAEWGGLAAAAWLVLWAGAFWRVAAGIYSPERSQLGVMLALLGIALHSTVHFPLQNPVLLLWTLLLLALAWSSAAPASTQPAETLAAN